MNLNKRTKGTGEIVRDIFIHHPDWNARQIYDRYLILIGDVNKAVTLNSIQKHVQELKEINNSLEVQNLEAPWHTGTLVKYPLSAEALPHIFKVQAHHQLGKITIRQARWVAHLYPMIKDTDLLNSVSFRYALGEKISQLSGLPLFDASEYDKRLESPKELIRYFEDSYGDFGTFKTAFESTTGYEMAGVVVQSVEEIYIFEGKAFVLTGAGYRQLSPKTPDAVETLVNNLKKQRLIKSMNTVKQEVRIIMLKKPMNIEVPAKSLMEVKSERSHSKEGKG